MPITGVLPTDEESPTKYYVIKDKNTGVQSCKGTYSWDKIGHIYTNLGVVKSHITRCVNRSIRRSVTADANYKGVPLRNVVIVEIEMLSKSEQTVANIWAAKEKIKLEKEERRNKRIENREKKRVAKLGIAMVDSGPSEKVTMVL